MAAALVPLLVELELLELLLEELELLELLLEELLAELLDELLLDEELLAELLAELLLDEELEVLSVLALPPHAASMAAEPVITMPFKRPEPQGEFFVLNILFKL